MIALFQYLLPVAATFLALVSLLYRDQTLREGHRAITFWCLVTALAFAIPLGLGLSSLIYFGWLVLGNPETQGYSIFEVVASILVSILSLRALIKAGARLQLPARVDHSVLAGVAVALFLFYVRLLEIVKITLQNPHGQFDAWAMWNAKARFLHRGGEFWTNALSELIPWSHPDYPLLLPTSIARGWLLFGGDTKFVPLLFSLLCAGSLALIMYSTVARLYDWRRGVIFLAFILAFGDLGHYASIQYADLPFALFLLAGIGAAFLGAYSQANRLWFAALSGCFLALSGWTKNEGLVAYLLVFGVFCLLNRLKVAWPQIGAFLLGSLPALAAVFVLKIGYASGNDLINESTSFAQVIEWARWQTISGRFVAILSLHDFSVLMIIAGLFLAFEGRYALKHGAGLVLAWSAVLGMAAVYFFIYLISHRDLNWHLSTSLDRLMFQLYPVFILAVAASLPNRSRGA